MKKIFIIFILLSGMFLSTRLSAQDKLDKVIEQQVELAKQQAITNAKLDKLSEIVAELAKQQAITATKVDGLEKSVDKRFDGVDKQFNTQLIFIVGLMGLIAVLIGAIFWDRKTALKPFEIKVIELEKEIVSLKERETKSENLLKKILEKYPDLAGLS